MDIKWIGSLMALIIFLLLIWVRFYRPKEEKIGQLETVYFEGVQKYKKYPSKELFKEVKEKGELYYQSLKLPQTESEKRIQDDLKR